MENKGFVLATLVWGIVAAIVAVFFGLIILSAVQGNTDLSRRGYQLDQQAYQACVTSGRWTPVECRAGEWGTR